MNSSYKIHKSGFNNFLVLEVYYKLCFKKLKGINK